MNGYYQKARDEKIASAVYDVFAGEMADEHLIEFIDTPLDDLIKYHHTLGQNIRNAFSMWEDEWEPVMDTMPGFGDIEVDVSPNHPDTRSQRAIETVWQRLKDERDA